MSVSVVLPNGQVIRDGMAYAQASSLHAGGNSVFEHGIPSNKTIVQLSRERFLELGGNPGFTDEDIEEYWADRYLQESPHGPVDAEHRDAAAALRAAEGRHYKNFDSFHRQWIENYTQMMRPSDTYVAVRVLADKYMDRLGTKDSVLQEASKGLWYYKFLYDNMQTEPDKEEVTRVFNDTMWIIDTPFMRANPSVALLALMRGVRRESKRDTRQLYVMAAILVFYLKNGIMPLDVNEIGL